MKRAADELGVVLPEARRREMEEAFRQIGEFLEQRLPALRRWTYEWMITRRFPPI